MFRSTPNLRGPVYSVVPPGSWSQQDLLLHLWELPRRSLGHSKFMLCLLWNLCRWPRLASPSPRHCHSGVLHGHVERSTGLNPFYSLCRRWLPRFYATTNIYWQSLSARVIPKKSLNRIKQYKARGSLYYQHWNTTISANRQSTILRWILLYAMGFLREPP